MIAICFAMLTRTWQLKLEFRSTSVVQLVLLAIVAWGHSVVAADTAWPYYRPDDVTPPQVRSTEWIGNEIDRFVLRKLEDRGLRPAPEASKRTLIRRLYFDLIGLPPAPQEVKAFLEDGDERAYERLVDRLLDDPRYGERWARLWLDLARYADTAGYEGDPDLPHAWRYRDYVIDAFNNDKPYDLFIREQIAGDEFQEIMGAGDLPETPPERLVAMTFLRLAPFTEPRGDETRHEMLSEMTSTVSSVFLGLTVGCAKCHDHKHDEIPTADFYRLKAFFATVQIPRPEPGDIYQIGGPLPAEFYRPGEQAWAQEARRQLEHHSADAKAELALLRERLAKLVGSGSGFGMQALGPEFGNQHTFDRVPVNDKKRHWTVVNTDGSKWIFHTDGRDQGGTGSLANADQGVWFGDIPHPKHISLGQYNAGSGAPMKHAHAGKFGEILIYDHPLSLDERTQLAEYVRVKYEQLAAKPKSTAPPQRGLRFWIDAQDVDADPTTDNPPAGAPITVWTDKVSGLELKQVDPSLQPTMDQLDDAPAVRFNEDFLIAKADMAKFLSDQQGALVAVYSARHEGEGYGFEVGGEQTCITTFVYAGGKANNLDDLIADHPSVPQIDRDRHRYLRNRDRFVKQHLKRLRPVAMSLRHSYGPPYEPGVPVSRVMERGEYDNPGEVVEPGFLSVITGNQEPADIRLDPFKRWPTRSRRMALAEWIANPANPMTHRVMVNRLWHWHFGRGIVQTPSDFGYLSGGPSHRELLDWLALYFVEQKWRIKSMHRLILNSSTYRQTSAHENVQAANLDPDNRLLWRFNRVRLDAEAIRDSVLHVSGRLNPEQYGLPIFPPLPGDVAEAVKYSESKWDTQHGPEGRKRSIYIYQQRTLTMPFMQTFDALVCDESRPRRRVSVTPLQALAMYNGAFVNEEAQHFATRVQQLAGDSQQRQIEMAFQLALGRGPSDAEFQRTQDMLVVADSPRQGLVGLCRVLFNSNEFLYVD